MSSTPRQRQRKLPPRPKIKLPVPGQFPGHFPQTPMGYVTTPFGQNPVTPGTAGQPTIVYTSKGSRQVVLEHFKGFKDWTKSGLSVGEKSAFWLYEKVSSWSRRWFTHLFLFFVLFLYSVLGAFLFIYIEGEHESNILEDIKKERDEMIQQIRDLWSDQELAKDSEKWKGSAKNHLMHYEEKLYTFLKKLNFQSRPDNVNWAFWNAVIYCSTIYTTIVPSDKESTVKHQMDDEEEMRARMERMVEDTERMEMEQQERPRSKPRQITAEVTSQLRDARSKSPTVNRPNESEVSKRSLEAVQKTEYPVKSQDQHQQQQQQQQQQQRSQSKNRSGEADQVAPIKEARRRLQASPEEAKSRHLSPAGNERDRAQQKPSGKKRSSRPRRRRISDEDDDDEDPDPATDQEEEEEEEEEEEDDDDDKDANIDVELRRHPLQRPVRQQQGPGSVRRASLKKQIILINNEDLMEDIAKAKRAYAHREPSDDYEYEDDPEEVEEEEEEHPNRTTRRRRETSLRRRKPGVLHTESEKEQIGRVVVQRPTGWFTWLFRRGSDKDKLEDPPAENKIKLQQAKASKSSESSEPKKAGLWQFIVSIFSIFSEFSEFCRQNPQEVQVLIELRNLCIVETIITLIVCGLGGLAFRFTEGAFESFYKCGVKRVKRDFLDSLWNYSHNMKEDDWKSMARRKLMEFEEQLHEAHEAGVYTYSGIKSWTFINSCMYCLTIISTIGYGHISPSTTTGRALTIIYAIIGIPLFLIVLADFGKLFTRGIKFLWAFVRRLYYTGSCRKVRRTVQVQEMMKGVQMVYDFATFRRPSQMSPEEIEEIKRQQQSMINMEGNAADQQPESPSTPAMSTFEIDDEFNLPISVAITILVLYIFVGALVFNVFEDWTFFESFYFVFISMSTIGFGDFVPQDPLYMMLSIVYMIFGLALTSMCINVVQVMLTDQFKQASQKIGASIGFQVSDEDGSLRPVQPVELAEVHGAVKTDEKEKIAPYAKQEEAEL